MAETYLLEWLDEVVTLSLNPKKTNVGLLTVEQSAEISEKAIEQVINIQAQLKLQVFALISRKQITILIENYHSALVLLLNVAIENQNKEELKRTDLSSTIQVIITGLDELLLFVELRFHDYLSMQSHVPATYLSISTKKLKVRLEKIKKSPAFNDNLIPAADIVYRNLLSFLTRKKGRVVTFRELYYRKGLIKELEAYSMGVNHDCATLNDLLIYMNFNSRAYLNFYTGCISDKINKIDDARDKLEMLCYYFKEFRKKQIKKGVVLNPRRNNLSSQLEIWFKSEVGYLKKKLRQLVLPLSSGQMPPVVAANEPKPMKVLCRLSADQVAIIIRAADESSVVLARSMTEVFKTIVPHLSTPHKTELSYDSIRSKSYSPEDRDKEVAVAALEKIIKKIKGY